MKTRARMKMFLRFSHRRRRIRRLQQQQQRRRQKLLLLPQHSPWRGRQRTHSCTGDSRLTSLAGLGRCQHLAVTIHHQPPHRPRHRSPTRLSPPEIHPSVPRHSHLPAFPLILPLPHTQYRRTPTLRSTPGPAPLALSPLHPPHRPIHMYN